MEKGKEISSWIKALALAIVLFFLIRSYVFTPIIVDGESMMPTLKDHDRIVLTKFGKKLEDINRFDIIVFHATEDKDYIKRVIGLPGDHIEYRNDILYVNGTRYEESYLDAFKAEAEVTPFTPDFMLEEKTGESAVPEGELFVMGDNRQDSMDSREIGTIPIGDVVGKANLVFWPLNDIKLVK